MQRSESWGEHMVKDLTRQVSDRRGACWDEIEFSFRHVEETCLLNITLKSGFFTAVGQILTL